MKSENFKTQNRLELCWNCFFSASQRFANQFQIPAQVPNQVSPLLPSSLGVVTELSEPSAQSQ